jgi:hypothetical protein
VTSPLPLIELPHVDVRPGVSGGREPLAGSRRAMGIEFGDVMAQVQAHPLFRAAMEAAGGRSIVRPDRLVNLFLILTQFWEPLRGADVVEFGSYRGGSTLFMAAILREVDPAARVHALDTYEGMVATDRAIDSHHDGDFGDADLPGLYARRDALGLDNLHIHKGLFEHTFPALAEGGPGVGLAHVDADTFAACSYAAEAAWPHMRRGGYVVFDDATTSSCLGATQAVEALVMRRGVHSEQITPHFVFRAGLERG